MSMQSRMGHLPAATRCLPLRLSSLCLLVIVMLSLVPALPAEAQTSKSSSQSEQAEVLQKALVPNAPDAQLQSIVTELNAQITNCLGPNRMDSTKIKQLQGYFEKYMASRPPTQDSLGYLSLVFVRLWEMGARSC